MKTGSKINQLQKLILVVFIPVTILCLTFMLDQWCKAWTVENLKLNARSPILEQTWLLHARIPNPGIAWGKFSQGIEGGLSKNFFTRYLPTAIILTLFVFALIRWKSIGMTERLAYALLVGGGASNLWDHWHSWRVVDTFMIWVAPKTYLPFNAADLAIMLATLTLLAIFGRQMIQEYRARNQLNLKQVRSVVHR